jgi:uncharacterized protein GlcG (DUF336 family)
MARYLLLIFLCLSACTAQQDKGRIAELEKQTKELQEQLRQLRYIQGTLPIVRNGVTVGAIGASGATSLQEEDTAGVVAAMGTK